MWVNRLFKKSNLSISYAEKNDRDTTIQFFDAMKESGCKRTIFMYKPLFYLICRKHKYDLIEWICKEMNIEGFHLNTDMYNYLLGAYKYFNNYSKMEEIFEKMKEENLTNIFSFQLMLKAYIKAYEEEPSDKKQWIDRVKNLNEYMLIKPIPSISNDGLISLSLSLFLQEKDFSAVLTYLQKFKRKAIPDDIQKLIRDEMGLWIGAGNTSSALILYMNLVEKKLLSMSDQNTDSVVYLIKEKSLNPVNIEIKPIMDYVCKIEFGLSKDLVDLFCTLFKLLKEVGAYSETVQIFNGIKNPAIKNHIKIRSIINRPYTLTFRGSAKSELI